MKVAIAIAVEELARIDNEDAIRCAHSIRKILNSINVDAELLFITKEHFLKNGQKIAKKITTLNPDVIFNLFEGFSDDSLKEITFAQKLEELNVTFTGNSSHCLSLCLDKNKTKELLSKNNLSIPKGIFLKNINEIKKISNLNFPLFIKPCFEDASVGINNDSLCDNDVNIHSVLKKKLFQFPNGILVEEFIDGNEFNISFTGNYPYKMLALSKIDYKLHANCYPFLSYKSKWDQTSTEYKALTPVIMKNCDSQLENDIISLATNAAKTLDCRGYFRVDLRESKNKLYIIDINPNPDINTDAGFVKQAISKGLTYRDIIVEILNEALNANNQITNK